MTYCLMLAIVDDDVDDDDGDNDDGDSTDDDDGDGEDTIALRNGVSKDRSTAGQSIYTITARRRRECKVRLHMCEII